MKVNIIIRCHCHCRFDFLFLVCIFVSSRLCVLVSWCLVVMFSILSANASIHLSLISSRKLVCVCVWCVKYFVWFFVLLLCVAVAVALLSAPFPTSEQSLPFPSLSSCHHLVSHSLAALLRFVCCLVNYVFIPSTSHPIPSHPGSAAAAAASSVLCSAPSPCFV